MHCFLISLLASFKRQIQTGVYRPGKACLARDQNYNKTIKICLRKHYFIDLDEGCNFFLACMVEFENLNLQIRHNYSET